MKKPKKEPLGVKIEYVQPLAVKKMLTVKNSSHLNEGLKISCQDLSLLCVLAPGKADTLIRQIGSVGSVC